jgi:lipopolysaccharide transport system ATP-binding protein
VSFNASDLKITGATLCDVQGSSLEFLKTGQPAKLLVTFQATARIKGVDMTVLIRDLTEEMRLVLNLNSGRDGFKFDIEPGIGGIAIELPSVALRPGLFSAKIAVSRENLDVFDAIESYKFAVKSDHDMSQCEYFQPRLWRLYSANEISPQQARMSNQLSSS